jgi:hypothetical protein
MVRTVGGVVETVVAKEGHNILSLARQRNREKLFTAIRPVGLLPTGSDDRANIGYATWRVTGVTGDVVEVEAHNGGDGPILEDGQHVGRYLEAADGTFWEIEDSDFGDQSFTLETGGGASFAVLDDVMIVATDTGQLMTDLVSPSGVAQFGYVQGVSQGRDLGHRNWVRNPAFGQWPNRFISVPMLGDGNQFGTTFDFKGLPAGYQAFAGDQVVFNAGFARNITADATADGSGNITLSVAGGSVTVTNNFGHTLARVSSRMPAPWAVTLASQPAIVAVGRHGAINQACNVDGAVASSASVALKNLPANFTIPAGTRIGPVWSVLESISDGSGNAIVQIRNAASGTFSDNQSLVLLRPALSGTGYAIGSLSHFASGTYHQNFYFRALGPTEIVTLTAQFGAWIGNPDAFTNWGGVGADTVGAKVILQNSTGTQIEAADPALINFDTADKLESASSQLSRALASGEYRFAIEPPSSTAVGAFWANLSCMVHIGAEAVPFVDGSAATRLFQEGNLALLASRQWPATYTARVAEIESAWGLPADSPALSVGNFIRLRSPSLDEDTLLRITQIEFNPLNPSDKILTLDADPERITQIAARARPRAVFVNVDVTVDNDGRARETVLVSDTPPALVVGVERFVVPAGTEAPTTPTALAVAPITQFDLGG